MGWEQSKGGRSYYVQKQRIGDQVISHYLGSGPTIELMAATDEAMREATRQRRIQDHTALQQLALRNAQNWTRFRNVERILTSTLESLGYIRYNRGPWQKLRAGVHQQRIADTIANNQHTDTTLNETGSQNQGDSPAGPTTNPKRFLEQLLSERINECQLQLSEFESEYFACLQQSCSAKKARLYQRIIAASQLRLTRATKSLATVQFLKLPSGNNPVEPNQ